MRTVLTLLTLACLAVHSGAADVDIEALPDGAAETATVRLNHIQVIGSHNSYHIARPPEELEKFKVIYKDADTLAYTHNPLPEQLDAGVRSFELDVYHDPDGARVLHVPTHDPLTTCETFVEGLTQLRDWSKAHPRHVPLTVLVEIKDEKVLMAKPPVLPFDAAAIEQLDTEIASVFEPGHLLTPDDVRGDAETLAEVIETEGWPLLDTLRGKIILILHARGEHARLYTDGRPTLQGRPMFLESQPGAPYAAIFVRNNPNDAEIAGLVKKGYVVRTRADADLRNISPEKRDTAFASGANIVTTDFPPGEPPHESGYTVALPNNIPARINPLFE